MKISAVCFDMDDTLCGYLAASGRGLRATFTEANFAAGVESALEAWRTVYKDFAREVKSEPWYDKYLESGEPTRTEHMRRMLALMGEDENRAAELSKRYAVLRDQNLRLFSEAREVLDELHGKYKMGLITNGPADVQRQEIATLGIGKYFDQVLIEGELKIGKPHSVVFEQAAAHWNLPPEEMLFVGNAFEHDVQAAKNVGWHAIWVNKADEENPGTRPQPDKEVFDLWDVVEWLGLPRPVGASPAVRDPDERRDR